VKEVAPNPCFDPPRRWLPLALMGGIYVLIGIAFVWYDAPGLGRVFVRSTLWIVVGLTTIVTSTTTTMSEVCLVALAFLATERLVTLIVVWDMADGKWHEPLYYLPILVAIWTIARLPPGRFPRD